MKTDNIKISPKWEKSKDEIWNETFADLEETNIKHSVEKKRIPLWRYIATSAAVILFAVTSFAFLYTTTETIGRGSHLALTLPDGSEVDLNAESEISYKPYWWFASRNVELKGEAYFEVNPGSRFTVKSSNNEVNVLGTSFNVFARANKYKVSCLTGKVEVKNAHDKTILTPNMQVVLSNDKFEITETPKIVEAISWKQNKFSFVGVPLQEVVDEIERQYDISITSSSKLDYLYTGNFSKSNNPEEILEIIGKPFDIAFKIED